MPTYDQQGNRLDGLGILPGESSGIGSSIWEIFHPGQVQQEFQATGQTAPTREQIISDAVANIGANVDASVQTIGQNVQGALAAAQNLIPWVVAGAVIVAISSHLPKSEKRKGNRR